MKAFEKQIELSVIVPVYKEEHNIAEFRRRITPVLDAITANYEILFALDPSPDRTAAVILEWRAEDPRIKLVQFSRRFGQPMATLGGLSKANGRASIVLDVDLQDPPELIAEMVKLWRQGFQVVYGQRRSREGEPWLKKMVALLGYRVINSISDVPIPRNCGDFRLMDQRVVQELLSLPEAHGFLRGLVALVGFRQTAILFDRPSRFAGETNYNRFLGSLRIGFNGIFCFSRLPLCLTAIASLVFFLISAATPFTHAVLRENPGLVVSLIFLAFGIQTGLATIQGAYLSRIYDEVKRRPKFIVDRTWGLDEGERVLEHQKIA